MRNKHVPNSRGDKLAVSLKQEIKQLRKSQKEFRDKNKRLTQELAKATHKDTLKLRKAENDIADLMQIQSQQKQRHEREMNRMKDKYKRRLKALQGKLRIMLGEKDEVDMANEGAITDLLETLTEELKERTNELEKSQNRFTELTQQNEELYTQKVKLEAQLMSPSRRGENYWRQAYQTEVRRNKELRDQLHKFENESDLKHESSREFELSKEVEELRRQLNSMRIREERRSASSSTLSSYIGRERCGYQQSQSLSSDMASKIGSRRDLLEPRANEHKGND